MRRDHPDVYLIDEPEPPTVAAPPAVVHRTLAPQVTPARLARMEAVAAARTRDVVVVLDGLTDPHNTSAVLRSADAFGVQEVHVVVGAEPFRAAHRVARGTHLWLDIVRHRTAEACAQALHARGFTILVATMGGEKRPEDLPALERVAIVFGNEHAGVSPALRSQADGTYAISMVGFVESLNVSVAAAITLHAATRGRAPLPEEDRTALVARWLLRTVRDGPALVARNLSY
jgi:tRNA (guanosine-2'-O-)-methyltransferase